MEIVIEEDTSKIPWWTWIAPFFIFQLGTQLSLLFQMQAPGSSFFYFPTPIALVLVFWWGPRVLVSFYLNAVFSAGLWNLPHWYYWPVYGLPEASYAFLAWYLFSVWKKGKYWTPDSKQFILFLLWVILFPLVIYKFFLEAVFLALGDRSSGHFFDVLLQTGLGEFIANVGLAVPVLYFFSSAMQSGGLTVTREPIPKPEFLSSKRSYLFWIEVFLVLSVLLGLSFRLDFEKFWFIYCFVSLYAAIRFGFEEAILTNLYIFGITYVLPILFHKNSELNYLKDLRLVNVYLGNSLLYVMAAVTGRVMTDLRLADEKLQQKNKELEQANKELDHFVYSASHDLSAPLKSIRGLVSISKLSNNPAEKEGYFTKIEASVLRLELFIGEVLDYSRNKRLSVTPEAVQLRELASEIFENLKYVEGFKRVKVDFRGILVNDLLCDKMRLRIILNNILSNGIKFQKKFSGAEPVIQIASSVEGDEVRISIEDNGEGIKEELQGGIFQMFFRGTQSASGSGLGLYIAKEAADKMGGIITVESKYGIGSKFVLKIKRIPGFIYES